MENNHPWLSTLTFLGFQLNSAIEAGHGSKISFDEVYRGLEGGTLIQDLSSKIPGEFDLGLLNESDQGANLVRVLNDAAEVFRGRELRKLGIEKSGLGLLLGIVLEAIQQKHWVDGGGGHTAARGTNVQ